MENKRRKKLANLINKMGNHYDWIFLLLSEPGIYLYKLIENTLMMGILVFSLNIFFVTFFDFGKELPLNIHTYIGLVIGLLLVFRTNTAYDRWWEARKLLDVMYVNLIYINRKSIIKKDLIEKYLDDLKLSLSGNPGHEENCLVFNKTVLMDSNFDDCSKSFLECYSALNRIKENPIPMSYSLHIKISLFIYILSLSFVMTSNIGFLSIPIVMIIFYIISGVEIISNEIENPFYGDPNDLPLDELFESWKKQL